MNSLKPICLFGLLFASLLATSVLAESPLISSHWEKDGWIITTKPEEAEITVNVAYTVPEVIHDRDTFYFKPFWSEVRKYADGHTEQEGCLTGCGIKTRCFGYTGISFDGMPDVQIEDEGIKVILDLSWSGRKTGHLKRDFLVPWSELEKTVRDKEVEIHVSVSYPKKPTEKQIQESQKIPVSIPLTTSTDSVTNSESSQRKDEIDEVVKDLGIMWDNGMFAPIKLPADAPLEEVVYKALQDSKRDLTFKKIRPVKILGDNFTGVIVYSKNRGEKIIFLRYVGDKVGWWSRVYNDPKSNQ